jgi:transposase
MRGGTRCAAHMRIGGRPSSLTPELHARIVEMLASGAYLPVALRAVGVPRQTFAAWLARGTSERESDAPFRDLKEAVEHAETEAECQLVAEIAAAARDSWEAAAWLLERRWPERWGNHQRSRRETAKVCRAVCPMLVEYCDVI